MGIPLPAKLIGGRIKTAKQQMLSLERQASPGQVEVPTAQFNSWYFLFEAVETVLLEEDPDFEDLNSESWEEKRSDAIETVLNTMKLGLRMLPGGKYQIEGQEPMSEWDFIHWVRDNETEMMEFDVDGTDINAI
jgi:hypothetical protein